MLEQETIREREGRWRPRPTLSGSEYTGPAVCEEERERIWWGDWVCLGRAEEVANPGDYIVPRPRRRVDLRHAQRRGRAPRLLQRVRAPRDEVPRRRARPRQRPQGVPLPVPRVDLRPRTGWLIGTPNVKEDEHFDRGELPAARVRRSTTYAGFMFVNLARGAAAADGRAHRRRRERSRRSSGSRWTSCGSACGSSTRSRRTGRSSSRTTTSACTARPIHPELVQVVPLFRFGEVWDEETRDDGNWMVEGATSFTMTGADPSCRSFPGLEPEDYSMYYGAYQFPNLMLNLHPDCAMYYIGYPEGPEPHDRRVRVPVPARDDRRSGCVQARAGRRALGPDLEAGLGSVRAGADRRGLARVHDRRLPAPGPLPVRVQRELPDEDGSGNASAEDRSTDGDQAHEPRRPVRAGRGEDLRVLPGRVRVPRRDGDAGGEVPPSAGLRQRPRPRALQHREGAGPSTAGRSTVGLYHIAWEVQTLGDLQEISREAPGGRRAHRGHRPQHDQGASTAGTPTVWSSRSVGSCRRSFRRRRSRTERTRMRPLDIEAEIERFGLQTVGGI